MPSRDKSADTDKRRHQVADHEKDHGQNAARRRAEAPAWPAGKLRGDNGKITARRKLPSGPLGGSGRKTNLARKS